MHDPEEGGTFIAGKITVLQGVSLKKLIFQMAVALNHCFFDPTTVKPKCV